MGRRRGGAKPAILWFAFLVAATLWLPHGMKTGTAGTATAATVVANRLVPPALPPSGRLSFSEHPADEEFLRAGISTEPLVPARPTHPTENRDLALAISAYEESRKAGSLDAVEPLVAFLAAHPDTAWRPSLLVSLGAVYRRGGHFSKALEAWQSAWDEARGLDGKGRAIGDAALAKLSQFEAYLGRKELLAPLLESVHDRPLHGAAAELVIESSRGLADMLDRPESSFRCGPLALERILLSESSAPPKASFSPLETARSTPSGLSLSAVAALSEKAGMHYQMAFRTAGADVIVPSVVHWKVGHYAAMIPARIPARVPAQAGVGVSRPDARFQVEDATFGESIRISKQTLDEEASGYFLVPPGPLPAGWRQATATEGDSVWGRGDTGANKDNGATGGGEPDLYNFLTGGCGGCTTWNVELSVVGLQLHDVPMGYKPPVGPPIDLEIYYSHRDVQQPQTFSYVNFGPKWTSTWLSYITNSGAGSVDLYRRGGGDEPYTFPGPSANVSVPGQFSQATLTQEVGSDGNPTSFTRLLKDGSVEKFTLAMGNQFFMTSIADPQGNAVTIKYDDKMRIVAIVDALGQVTTWAYGLASDPLKVTQVKDPFGRAATFTYTPDGSFLASITDTIGITSSYEYSSNDLVKTLTTPYGTTTFVAVDNVNNNAQRYLTITDTLGRVSHIEFQQSPPGVSNNDLSDSSPEPLGMATTDGLMQWRNTYIFDPTQYQLANGSSGLDFSKARLVHWLHTLDDSTSRIPESMKQPSENRLWNDYQGQSAGSLYVGSTNQPWHTGRVLDDGSTALWTYLYNSIGNVTQAVDPAGRRYEYAYNSAGIDMLSVTNTTNGKHELLYTLTYNAQHEPLTVVEANGATTTYEYNSVGQMTKRTDANGGVTTYGYTDHSLTSVQGPLGATYSMTYDSVGRLASAEDPSGETVKYEYDAADRLTKASFPDGTASTFSYSLLDLKTSTDRLGRTTTIDHDSERELVRVTDPLGETVAFTYSLAGKLESFKDGNGHETTLTRDEQERLTAKKYADGTAYQIAYEQTTSRVHSKTDPLGHKATYAYNADDTLQAVTYAGAHVTTPSVSYTYDSAYKRRTSMTDGTGTTKYAYFPVSTKPALGANYLQTLTIPVAGTKDVVDTVSYTYDLLNRPTAQTVDGTVESWGYDALSRTTSAKNGLDAFAYSYADRTARVSGVTSARGPAAALTYYGVDGDQLVQQATFKTASGTPLSSFGYKYDADDNVTTFTQTYVGQKLASGGDGGAAAGLMTDALATPKGGGAGAGNSSKVEDLFVAGAGIVLLAWGAARRWSTKLSTRRPSFLVPVLLAVPFLACGTHQASTAPPSMQVTSYAYDGANRLTSAIVGTDVAAPSAPQYSYGYDSASNLIRTAAPGSQTSPKYTATNALAAGSYDASGNPTSLNGATYTWDGANRLATATIGGSESAFSYDGDSRLVRVVTSTVTGEHSTVASDVSYTWCGEKRCLAHDNQQSGSPVSARYYDQGAEVGAQALYYVADRLGSVRQLVDTTGSVRAQYDYDPYGGLTKISGTLDSDVGFTGLARNASTGLAFARHRAYDAGSGRWLNRDPFGEAGGFNLYGYAGQNPTNLVDPSGLCFVDIGVSGGFGIGGTAGVQIGNDGDGNFGIHPYAGVGITTPGLGASVQTSAGSIGTGNSAQASASAGPVVGSVSTSGSGDPTVEGGYGWSIGPPGSVGIYGVHTW